MDLRIILSVVLTVFIAALCVCMVFARKSHKAIGKSVAWLEAAFIPPIIGNLIIIGAHTKEISAVGSYIYFIGMDVVMLAFMNFASAYCKIEGQETKHRIPFLNYILLGGDAIQLLLNTVFGHAFDLEPVEDGGLTYYRLVPYWGQAVHRIIDYGIFLAIVLIFIIMIVRLPRIYREKYIVLLISMAAVGLWQTINIFSRAAVENSMVGYGVFGVLAFFFSLHYRPLRLLDRMLSNIASEMQESMFLYDPTGKCVWINEAAAALTGLNNTQLDGVNPRLTEMFGALEYSDEDVLFSREIGSGINTRYYTISKRVMRYDNKKISGTVISIRDDTEEKLKLKRELYNATHDKLTGLFTREYLYECIRSKIDSNPDTTYLIVFVDVKNFKIVNDIFGAKFGDKAIQSIADLIRSMTNEKCVYGRLAGDTFGVLTPRGVFHIKDIEKKLSQFAVSSGSTEHKVLIHLGIYEVDDPKLDVSVMFDRAHLALSTINDRFNTHLAFYDTKIRENVLWNQTISSELDTAIEERQIRPYLQPIADRDGNIVGAEALARWLHPQYGFMPPASFIPIFEKNGMIVEVDKHIWRCACEILSRWDNEMFISVNISPKDFYYTDVVGTIKELVSEYGIEPRRLRIEITESVMMSDSDSRMAILDDLRSAGFIVEMDDFGSGYSSLNMLKNMPVDVLKIDMMFLAKSDNKNRSQTIVRNIIRLSDELGISTLTEGVETEEQYIALSGMGCDLFQGYYFAKPIPVEDFENSYLSAKVIDER